MLERKEREERGGVEGNGVEREEIEIRGEVVRVWEREIKKGFLFVTVYTNL